MDGFRGFSFSESLCLVIENLQSHRWEKAARRVDFLLEVFLEPSHQPDAYIDPTAEPYLKGEEYDGLSGDELPDPELD